MEIKKNDCFTVSIEDMSEDGSGIGKLDGYIWFIKDAVKGDVGGSQGYENEEILRFCPSDARDHSVPGPDRTGMSRSQTVRRMPASGYELREPVKI